MSRAIHRHRAIFGDELIGYVNHDGQGWRFETTDRSSIEAVSYPSEEAAEDALRDAADQTRGERILATAFIVALVAHPLLYVARVII